VYPRKGVALVPEVLRAVLVGLHPTHRTARLNGLPAEVTFTGLDPKVWDELSQTAINDLAAEVVRALRLRMSVLAGSGRMVAKVPREIGELKPRTRNALVNGRILQGSTVRPVALGELVALPNFGALSLLDVLTALEASAPDTNGNSSARSQTRSPQTRSRAVELGASKLAKRRWARHVSASDPRFGALVQVIDPDATTAADAAERAARDRFTKARKREVLEAITELNELGQTAKRATLSEELDQVAEALTSTPKAKEMVKLRLGLGGLEPMTLGKVADRVGVSRERVRQVVSSAMDKLEGRHAWMPALERAWKEIAKAAPADTEEIQDALSEAGLVGGPFSLLSLIQAAEVFGLDHGCERDRKTGVVMPPGVRAPLTTIQATARRLVERWGVTTVADVAEALDGGVPPSEENMLSEIVESMVGFQWLERERAWFWFSDLPRKRNRLLNQIEKIMSVAGTIELGELRDGVGRHHRMEGFRPPRRVLAALCEQTGLYRLDGEMVIGEALSDWRQILGNIERTLVEVIFENGPLLRREELERLALEAGVNRNSFWVYLSYSPVLRRYAPGVYGLRGSRVTAAEVEVRIPPRIRTQVLQDEGWTKGQPWAAFRISPSSESSGVLTAPRGLRRVASGRFELYAPEETPVGTVVVEQSMWGLSPFFRRWGVEAGDLVVVSFDLQKRRAFIEAGDEELLLRYQQGE
jgi:hypothetical protein